MIVVKLGGAALKASLQNPALFAPFRNVKDKLLIVHGGGPAINQLAEKMQLATEFFEGQRVTTAEHMKVVEMVLSGSINPEIVRGLLIAGVRAVGLSGVDGKLLECVEENPKLGLVGKVTSVRSDVLDAIWEKGLTPVVSPVGLFENGQACNVNADLAAAALASQLGAEKLLFLTDKDGILDAKGEALAQMSREDLEALNQTPTISGGMKVKVRAILEFLESRPGAEVAVMNGLDALPLTQYFEGTHLGTAIR